MALLMALSLLPTAWAADVDDTSSTAGAAQLLVDNVSRNLLAVEIPIGILTAFIGAPFFIYLMTRKEHVL